MRLKVLTTTLLIAGVVLLLVWPFVFNGRPRATASRLEKAQWGQRVLVYFGVTAGTWLATAFSAMMLARQTQRQFLTDERDNLKGLIEGTLRDHGRES